MLNLKLPPRVTVKAHGRGAGKTYAATQWALERALSANGVEVAMIGNKSDRDEFLSQFIATGERHGIAVEIRPATRSAILENGSKIVFYDIFEPDRLRGPSYKYVVGENVGLWPEETYENAKFICRGGGSDREAMFYTFVGAKSPRILDMLSDGFEATTK